MTILLVDLALIVGLAQVSGVLARRIGQPPVVGEILAGILLGPTLLGDQLTQTLFPQDVRPLLSALAGVGVAAFMFLVGLELDGRLLRGMARLTVSVTVGAMGLPMVLGAALALLLARGRDGGADTPFVLFMAVAMSVTAFPVLARIIADRGMSRTALAGVALSCAAACDALAWSLLAVVVALASADGFQLRMLLLVPYLLLMLAVVRPLLRRWLVARRAARAGEPTHAMLGVTLSGLLASAAFTEWIGLHYIFGAFLFGAVMPRDSGDALREGLSRRLEPVSTLLLPVYFVVSGLSVDLSGMDAGAVGDLLVIVVVAVAGKFLGAFTGARLQGMDVRDASVLGTLLNTRGLTELVVLGIGRQLGLLNTALYSSLVVMAVVTTMMTGPALHWLYRRTPTGNPLDRPPPPEAVPALPAPPPDRKETKK